MSHYIATVIDTTGIQKYVFGSNRLKENIGASHLVKLATVEWVKECLRCLGNVHIPDEDKDQVEPRINTDENIIAELVYAGGGNTVLLFSRIEDARSFTQKLTIKILEDAPGLNIVIADHPFNWDTQLLRQIIETDLIKGKLDAKKRQPIPSVPLLGLSVTATCRSTGLVAVEDTNGKYGIPDGEGYLASREIIAKLKAADEANTQFKEILFKDKPSKYKIARDVDDMGRTEQESSYIALIHADGNQMGKRFENYGKAQQSNRDFIVEMRRLSWAVSKAASSAIEEVGKLVINAIETGKISIKENYLPFRPIVYGGDDVTFVCDGRIGLPLAVKFLKEFEERTKNLPDGKGKATACAGIAIVKTHYPFSRTYELCEALCSSAKKFVRQETEDHSDRIPIFSALDWHIAPSGLLGSIGEIREVEYQGGKLTTRPMRSHEYGDDWLIWTDFAEVVRTFNEEEPWKDKRNKVITLRELLREGQTATEQFLNTYGINELPIFLKANSALKKQGWIGGRCRYFDAIEAMEFYIPLGE
ncbi:Cas10/Cmr2 second palm domain-containing protein [Microcoleus sp. herbarium12]|uniref:Cas10/Cmr2 second palm domain-containing protein n=1 Tax=Microcoleus sp. herbarium12 TaxID=3055437 RepID=UPI002FD04FF5